MDTEICNTKVYKLLDYTALFSFYGGYTFVAIFKSDPKVTATGGAARCNPRDEYNQDTGMLVAMRRACGIPNGFKPMPEVFRAYRKARFMEKQNAPRS